MTVLASCESPPPILQQGKWTGTIVPMNHPEMRSDLYYRVSYEGDALQILIGMPEMESRDARNIHLTADSLHFEFDEPEPDVPVKCAFGLQPTGTYEGPCSEASGKSAYFTMRPPDAAGGQEA